MSDPIESIELHVRVTVRIVTPSLDLSRLEVIGPGIAGELI
jgi:hypothetical protein